MTNKYLEKIAESDHLKDLKDTVTIGALGGVATMGSHHLLSTGRIGRALEGMSAKRKLGTIGLVGTGIGLAADYAGLKLNKATDKLLPQNKTKEQNVPL